MWPGLEQHGPQSAVDVWPLVFARGSLLLGQSVLHNSTMTTPATPQKAPLVKVVVLGDAGYASRLPLVSFLCQNPKSKSDPCFPFSRVCYPPGTFSLCRVGKTSLLQRYDLVFHPLWSHWWTKRAILLTNLHPQSLSYVVKEFSDNYKTTIGADFMSMDVTTDNDKKVSLQVRRECYTCSIKFELQREAFGLTFHLPSRLALGHCRYV